MNNHKHTEPTGPMTSFIALQYPLTKVAQNELKRLAKAIEATSECSKATQDEARNAIDEYIATMRKVIGVEVIRREYLIGVTT